MEDTGVTALTGEGVFDGLEHKWVSFEGAIEKMKGCELETELGISVREKYLSLSWRCGGMVPWLVSSRLIYGN